MRHQTASTPKHDLAHFLSPAYAFISWIVTTIPSKALQDWNAETAIKETITTIFVLTVIFYFCCSGIWLHLRHGSMEKHGLIAVCCLQGYSQACWFAPTYSHTPITLHISEARRYACLRAICQAALGHRILMPRLELSLIWNKVQFKALPSTERGEKKMLTCLDYIKVLRLTKRKGEKSLLMCRAQWRGIIILLLMPIKHLLLKRDGSFTSY